MVWTLQKIYILPIIPGGGLDAVEDTTVAWPIDRYRGSAHDEVTVALTILIYFYIIHILPSCCHRHLERKANARQNMCLGMECY